MELKKCTAQSRQINVIGVCPQVIGSSARPAPACTAQSLQSESPADSSWLPASPFESCGLTPRRPPAVPSDWSRQLATAFRSEELPAPASLSCWTHLRSVRLTAPPLSPVRPGLGGLNTADPLPDARPAIPIFPRTCAPLRGFTPSGSKRLPDSDRMAHLPDALVCLSLPAAVSIDIGTGCGSTFQARFASEGLLFL